MRVFVDQYPELLDCGPFRDAVANQFGADLLKEMEADRDFNARRAA